LRAKATISASPGSWPPVKPTPSRFPPAASHGGYTNNTFTDIFLVTNNTTTGTLTNYLDIGAATNKPSRYYRARLVP
jgi:hypothetical protein